MKEDRARREGEKREEVSFLAGVPATSSWPGILLDMYRHIPEPVLLGHGLDS